MIAKPLRKIIHIDMDCFYAAIEERDNPRLKGQPIAVGGAAHSRGVLCTANYLARKSGVHSAMPTSQALKLCPHLILLPVDMPKYRAVSRQIRDIFSQFTELIEPLSLDEAYLDVTHCALYQGSATWIAQEIKRRIQSALQLTASAGVASNKFLAKVASDWQKPNGLFVIRPEQVADFVAQLPITKLFGVGKVTAGKLQELGVYHCGDLQTIPKLTLVHQFGKGGERLFELCRGIDNREVQPHRVRRSLSVERTLIKDLPNPAAAQSLLGELYKELQQRLHQHSNRVIKSQFVRIKFYDFSQTTVEESVAKLDLDKLGLDTLSADQLDRDHFWRLFQQGYLRQGKPFRLLGLGVRFAPVEEIDEFQLTFTFE